ncbi:hypothetical protein Cob_v011202 [Colletotrichum orbiculare MAFF 240422]|uniref:Uncharacterized protein n=1 Tax=Colletotrichum orbiculare (strain 104-T / ATCC 96160 / CBS 514.97 / LARS 414 / MAFF 240422) TaxID=1213857 RepID=A0A484FD12_COLOR|nr:hypothetical protein Cob_v011202 [Colletotrichum orbiculare MAFF 240422]
MSCYRHQICGLLPKWCQYMPQVQSGHPPPQGRDRGHTSLTTTRHMQRTEIAKPSLLRGASENLTFSHKRADRLRSHLFDPVERLCPCMIVAKENQ